MQTQITANIYYEKGKLKLKCQINETLSVGQNKKVGKDVEEIHGVRKDK